MKYNITLRNFVEYWFSRKWNDNILLLVSIKIPAKIFQTVPCFDMNVWHKYMKYEGTTAFREICKSDYRYGDIDLGKHSLVQVMACCLTAPSHSLNQCWLILSKVLWQPVGYFTRNAQDICAWYELKITNSRLQPHLAAAKKLKHHLGLSN